MRFSGRPLRRPISLLLGAALAGCASGGTSQSGAFDDDFVAPGLNPDQGEAIPSVRFFMTAEENWQAAEKMFSKKQYLGAQQYYAFIRTKFPYSRFATLSDLRIADCQFEREHYIEAIDTYQNFARLHPTSPQLPYALFRTGMAHYEQIPSGWFLLPPSYEKDQTAVEDAAEALGLYLQRYPNDDWVEEARKAYEVVRKRLMAHERYVADFYRKTGHHRGYVLRLETMKRQFGDVALDPDLLLEIAEAYTRLGEVESVASTFDELEKAFPESPVLQQRAGLVARAEEARQMLEQRQTAAKGDVTSVEREPRAVEPVIDFD
ncbi:MAG: outer membrane protein assembly factor BamD [Myxococcales bacterium]|nr:outer membrane protein assembly factor BamD [Myxococcales bacterium]